MLVGVAAENEEFSQAVRVSGTLAYIALLSQSVVHPVVQSTLIADVRKGIVAQFRTACNKVRKLSHAEPKRGNGSTGFENKLSIISSAGCENHGTSSAGCENDGSSEGGENDGSSAGCENHGTSTSSAGCENDGTSTRL